MSVAPDSGDIVRVRTRHYEVYGASSSPYGTVLDLACMDDDSQGSRLSAIWELELDGKIITLQACESIGCKGFDPRSNGARDIADRARIESEEMTPILEAQRNRVIKSLREKEAYPSQFDFFEKIEERRQIEDNMRYWRKWLEEVETDLTTEPVRIADFYAVKTTRIEPVGIVYLWSS